MKVMVKRMHLIFIALFLFGISACNNGSVEVEKGHETVYTIKEVAANQVKSIAYVEIEGLTCEKMCVGLINKAVKNLRGVENSKIAFQNDRKTNICEIEFSAKELKPEEIVNSIQELANGQYKVRAVHVTNFVIGDGEAEDAISEMNNSGLNGFQLSSKKLSGTSNDKSSQDESESETPAIKIPQITLPNILTLITSLLKE